MISFMGPISFGLHKSGPSDRLRIVNLSAVAYEWTSDSVVVPWHFCSLCFQRTNSL